MALKLVVNGHEREFSTLNPQATLAALVAELALKGDRVAVERNGEIAERARWPEIALDEGDRLEVVHFVGGGSGSRGGPGR